MNKKVLTGLMIEKENTTPLKSQVRSEKNGLGFFAREARGVFLFKKESGF